MSGGGDAGPRASGSSSDGGGDDGGGGVTPEALSRRRLPLAFFARPTLAVARDLLGRLVCRRHGGQLLVARLVEVEAYVGPTDLACHASRGRTRRNDPLWRRAGTLYVYFTYGLHWLANVVTEREGYPSAVLLRAADPVTGVVAMRRRRADRADHELLRGPASLCRALAIDGALDGAMARGPELWFAAGAPVADGDVRTSPRIGVDYAGESRDWPWRFFVAGRRSVSGRRGLQR